MLAPGALLAAWLALGGALLRMTLEPAQRAAVDGALGPLVQTHGMLAVLWWLIAAALAAWAASRLHAKHIAAPMRLADAARALEGDPDAPDLAPSGGAATRALGNTLNRLAHERRELRQDMARLVEEASRSVAQQRDQLGALMAELNQSVMVCNLEGRILLYNERTRRLFGRTSSDPKDPGGASLIGLGRSIYGVFDRAIIAHALETIERRMARDGDAARAAAHFVTDTRAGHLLRVSVAPVRPASPEGASPTGLVFVLDDIGDAYQAQTAGDRLALDLTETSRASLASIQAALDMLDYPDLAADERERFAGVVRAEVSAMGARLAAFADATSRDLATRWPLEDMLGADLIAAAARRIDAHTGRTPDADEIDPTLWLRVDSFALIQSLVYLAGRLSETSGGPGLRLRLRLKHTGGRAHLDLIWSGKAAVGEALTGWDTDAMQIGADRSPLTVRDVVERHGGEFWSGRDRDSGDPYFRFLLPLAAGEPAAAALGPRGSRPEYYDFDLLGASEGNRDLDDRPLDEIAYTVFDTETTGLDPAGGDEIIQIGATRIVNGRLLRGECFDQLVDPRRSIPEALIPIHGIGPEMVRGKPTIEDVLPVFHAFVADTVLVGHNVAFDLRFLTLKEEVSGVRFDQPVLDTLLLSSIAHPAEASHGLEAIAAQLGVAVSGRHNALGDALMTAEVFLKLLPLLRARGVTTLGEARRAVRKSYYARLRY